MSIVYVKAKPGHAIALPEMPRRNPPMTEEQKEASQGYLYDYLKAPIWTQVQSWDVRTILVDQYDVEEDEAEGLAEQFQERCWEGGPAFIAEWENRFPGILEKINEETCNTAFHDGHMEALPMGCVFHSVEKVPEGTWCIHFTNADFNSFDVGAPLHALAYTGYNESERASEDAWVYAFAFEADVFVDLDDLRRRHTGYHGKYGDNYLIFQVDHAVRAYHSEDNEYQIIFQIGTEYNVLNATSGVVRASDEAIAEAEAAEEAEEEYDEDALNGEFQFSTIEELMELMENGLVDPNDFDNYRGV